MSSTSSDNRLRLKGELSTLNAEIKDLSKEAANQLILIIRFADPYSEPENLDVDALRTATASLGTAVEKIRAAKEKAKRIESDLFG